jgi:uncharacterized OB-fold protein
MSEAQTLGIQAQHQAALAEGRFLIQKCSACARHVYFPRDLCPHCGSGDVAFVEPSGMGAVYSTTVVRRKADAGGDYNVALIDLDEGVRLMSCVDNIAPTDVKIGQRVIAKVTVANGSGHVMFDAVGGGAA